MTDLAWTAVVVVAFLTGFSLGWWSRMRYVIERLREYQRRFPKEGA